MGDKFPLVYVVNSLFNVVDSLGLDSSFVGDYFLLEPEFSGGILET